MTKQYLIDDYSVQFFPNDLVALEDCSGNKIITTVQKISISEFGVIKYYLNGFLNVYYARDLTKVY